MLKLKQLIDLFSVSCHRNMFIEDLKRIIFSLLTSRKTTRTDVEGFASAVVNYLKCICGAAGGLRGQCAQQG